MSRRLEPARCGANGFPYRVGDHVTREPQEAESGLPGMLGESSAWGHSLGLE